MTQHPEALKGAIAVGLSTFAGITSFFSAVMAAGVARFLEGDARTQCYLLAVASVINGLVSLARGRRSLAMAIACAVAFVVINIAVVLLYVMTW